MCAVEIVCEIVLSSSHHHEQLDWTSTKTYRAYYVDLLENLNVELRISYTSLTIEHGSHGVYAWSNDCATHIS